MIVVGFGSLKFCPRDAPLNSGDLARVTYLLSQSTESSRVDADKLFGLKISSVELYRHSVATLLVRLLRCGMLSGKLQRKLAC